MPSTYTAWVYGTVVIPRPQLASVAPLTRARLAEQERRGLMADDVSEERFEANEFGQRPTSLHSLHNIKLTRSFRFSRGPSPHFVVILADRHQASTAAWWSGQLGMSHKSQAKCEHATDKSNPDMPIRCVSD